MNTKIDPEAVGFLISDVARLLRAEFDRRTAEAGVGLTPAEARTLANIARAGAVRQNVLAERIGVEAMTMSAYLDRLEARGLVARQQDPNDRRAKLVQITDEAQSVIASIIDVSQELRTDVFGAFSQDEWQVFRDVLKQVRGRLIDMRPECGKDGAA